MKNGKYRKAATFSLSGCPLREEKSFSQRAFSGSLSRVGVNVFLRHRNDVSVPLYVRARKIRFLKFLKFRYPKAFRLITLMALFVPSVKPFV